MNSMIDWDSASSSFSRAASSSTSRSSDTAMEVRLHMSGAVSAARPAKTAVHAAFDEGTRRVTFSDPPTQEDEDDVEEIDDPGLIVDLMQKHKEQDPLLSSVTESETLTDRGEWTESECASFEQPPVTVPPPPPERLMEPSRTNRAKVPAIEKRRLPVLSGEPPAVCMDRVSSWMTSTTLAENEPSQPRSEPCPAPQDVHPLPRVHEVDNRARANGSAIHEGKSSSTVPERRPVNERAASEARARCSTLSATMLTTYHTIKRNTRARLYRRYYDKWRLLLASCAGRKTTTTGTEPISSPGTESRWTQTEHSPNDDVESYSGPCSMSPRISSTGSGAGRELLARSLSWPDTGSEDSQDARPCPPPALANPVSPRPVFQFSRRPDTTEGIAASSRPAGQPKDVRKSDMPPRKGCSPSRSGPSVSLPAVVADPVRVYRK